MALAGGRAILLPSELLETLGKAITDIDNRGLETVQITRRACGQDQAAVGTAIAAHRQGLSTAVKISAGEAVRPDAAASTARTSIRSGPGKTSTELKDALDGGFDEKYQWRCFRERNSHLPGAKGAPTPFAPIPFPKPE